MNYDEIQDAIDLETDLAYDLGYPSVAFEHAVALLQQGVNKGYNQWEWLALIEDIHYDQYQLVRGEDKYILESLLVRVEDIVRYE